MASGASLANRGPRRRPHGLIPHLLLRSGGPTGHPRRPASTLRRRRQTPVRSASGPGAARPYPVVESAAEARPALQPRGKRAVPQRLRTADVGEGFAQRRLEAGGRSVEAPWKRQGATARQMTAHWSGPKCRICRRLGSERSRPQPVGV